MFLLCWEHDPCSLYLGAMIMRMGIFIGCEYGSHTGLDATTLLYLQAWQQVLEEHILEPVLGPYPPFRNQFRK